MADINEILSKEALDSIKELDKLLINADGSITKIIATSKQLDSTLKNISGAKEFNAVMKDMAANQTTLARVTKQRVAADKEAEKATKKVSEAVDRQRKKEEEHIAALNLEVKTVGEAIRQNKALREERNKSAASTTGQTKEIREYNRRIEENDKLIKQNGTSLEKQRLNIGNYRDALKGLGTTILATFSVGSILAFGRAAFQAAESQDVANRKLLYALKGNQAAFSDMAASAGILQSKYGIPDDKIMELQVASIESGKTATETKKLTQAAIELSTVTGMDLDSAYKALSATYSGVSKGLNKIDAEFGTLTKSQLKNGDAIDMVLNKYGGIAQEAVTPTKQLSAAWGEFMETLGGGESGPINWAIKKLAELTNGAKSFYEWAFKYGGSRKLQQESKQAEDDAAGSLKRWEDQLETSMKKVTKAKWKELADAKGAELDNQIKQQQGYVKDLEGKSQGSQDAWLRYNQERIELELMQNKKRVLVDLTEGVKTYNKAEEEGTKKKEKAKTAYELLTQKISDLREQIASALTTTGQVPEGLARQLIGSEAELNIINKQVEDITKSIQMMASKGYATTTDAEGKKVVQNIAGSGQISSRFTARQGPTGPLGASDPTKMNAKDWGNIALESAGTVTDAAFTIIANADQKAFDHKMSLLDKEKEKKLSVANLTEKQKAKIEADYAKKTAKLKEEQFKKEKAASIIQALINTALAVTKAAPNPAQMLLAGLVGAAQIAVIAAQPIPEFDKGTLSTPSNFIAGEKRPEWMRMPSGQWRFVDRPTMFKNLRGATVVSGEQTERLRKAGLRPDGIDLRPELNKLREDVVSSIRNKRELTISATGSKITEREGSYNKEYFNRHIKWAGK